MYMYMYMYSFVWCTTGLYYRKVLCSTLLEKSAITSGSHLDIMADFSKTLYFWCTFTFVELHVYYTSGMLSILGERERSHWLLSMSQLPSICASVSVALHVVVERHDARTGAPLFLHGLSVPSTLLLKGTTPRQALLPLPGTLTGADVVVAGYDVSPNVTGPKRACSWLAKHRYTYSLRK